MSHKTLLFQASAREKLLRGALREAAKLGASFVKMEVDHANTGAQSFYNRLGFSHAEDDLHYILEEENFTRLLKDDAKSTKAILYRSLHDIFRLI